MPLHRNNRLQTVRYNTKDFNNISDLEYCHPVSKEVYKMLTLPVFPLHRLLHFGYTQ